jgi:hypothetical protein
MTRTRSLFRLALVLCLILSGIVSTAMAAPTRAEAYGFDVASLCGNDDPASESGGMAGHDCLSCCLFGGGLDCADPTLAVTPVRPASKAPGLCDPLPLRAERRNPGWQGRAPPLT